MSSFNFRLVRTRPSLSGMLVETVGRLPNALSELTRFVEEVVVGFVEICGLFVVVVVFAVDGCDMAVGALVAEDVFVTAGGCVDVGDGVGFDSLDIGDGNFLFTVIADELGMA